jgi:hypothetical protein
LRGEQRVTVRPRVGADGFQSFSEPLAAIEDGKVVGGNADGFEVGSIVADELQQCVLVTGDVEVP